MNKDDLGNISLILSLFYATSLLLNLPDIVECVWFVATLSIQVGILIYYILNHNKTSI